MSVPTVAGPAINRIVGVPRALETLVLRKMFLSKIHRATVTQADLHYEGSVTIDRTLMDAAGILDHEWVCVWNVTNGNRLETYALEGEAGSGVICLNGAAAHRFTPGDLVIIATSGWLDEDEVRNHVPTVVLVGEGNTIKKVIGREIPGPDVRED